MCILDTLRLSHGTSLIAFTGMHEHKAHKRGPHDKPLDMHHMAEMLRVCATLADAV